MLWAHTNHLFDHHSQMIEIDQFSWRSFAAAQLKRQLFIERIESDKHAIELEIKIEEEKGSIQINRLYLIDQSIRGRHLIALNNDGEMINGSLLIVSFGQCHSMAFKYFADGVRRLYLSDWHTHTPTDGPFSTNHICHPSMPFQQSHFTRSQPNNYDRIKNKHFLMHCKMHYFRFISSPFIAMVD